MTALLQVSGYVRRQSAKGDEKRPRFTQPVIDTAAKLWAEIDAEYVRALKAGLADFSGE